ncbi:hypothetical protein N7466_006304 [Penicillium verhagenii]|uniref:uncharacterized protein n=1 Tax=Penicillium verhagenii TaxID=1562060 RepID=UPI002545959D|nr:uncharacterized protein N7466_006304 [Penicillium verhagenii]KAJ5930811.1 hypothetical protein N7466_006304 [Penicillium verhagenii]
MNATTFSNRRKPRTTSFRFQDLPISPYQYALRLGRSGPKGQSTALALDMLGTGSEFLWAWLVELIPT